jgi:Mg2+-importing ATPase
MLYVGPISSVFDFLTFYVLLRFFHASEAFFHTGWFLESLATQTLVIYVIRTTGNPFQSRPSRPLVITTLLVVAVGALLPVSGLAGPLGFVPLTATFYLFLAAATLLYLMSVQLAKGLLWRRAEGSSRAVGSP